MKFLEKVKKHKIVAVVLIALMCMYGYSFFTSLEEKDFIARVEKGFLRVSERTSKSEKIIRLESIYDFEWDRVCGVAKDSYFESEEVRKKGILGARYMDAKISLPNLRSFKFNWAFVFIKNETPIKVLEFSRWASIDSEDHGKFYIGYTDYSFYGSSKERTTPSPSCFEKDKAILKVDYHTSRLMLGGAE